MANSKEGSVLGIVDTDSNRMKIEALTKQGLDIRVFPEITVVENSARFSGQISEFSIVIFRDIYAVEFFLNDLDSRGVDLFDFDDTTVCAVGEAVADRLRFSQVHADIIPARASIEEISSSILKYQNPGVDDSQSHLLLLEANNSGSVLDKKLTDLGFDVTVHHPFEFADCDSSTAVRFRTMLHSGAVDEFLFRSVEDIESVKRITGSDHLDGVFDQVKALAIDGQVFQALREHLVVAEFFTEQG